MSELIYRLSFTRASLFLFLHFSIRICNGGDLLACCRLRLNQKQHHQRLPASRSHGQCGTPCRCGRRTVTRTKPIFPARHAGPMHHPDNNKQTTSHQHHAGLSRCADPQPHQEDSRTRMTGAHKACQIRPDLSAAERNKDQQKGKQKQNKCRNETAPCFRAMASYFSG